MEKQINWEQFRYFMSVAFQLGHQCGAYVGQREMKLHKVIPKKDFDSLLNVCQTKLEDMGKTYLENGKGANLNTYEMIIAHHTEVDKTLKGKLPS